MACTTKASASGARFAYVKMTDCETVPTSPALQEVGFTSETLSRNTGQTESTEIYSDRNKRDTVQTSVDVSGSVNVEWRIEALEDWILSALQANSVKTLDLTEAVSIDATDQDAVVLTQDGGTGAFGAVAVGEALLLGEYTNAGNNGAVRVVGITDADTITVRSLEGKVLVTEAGDAANTVYARTAVNGQTREFYLLEKTFTDMTTPTYFRFLAQEVSGFNVSFGAQSIVTGDFSFIGRSDEQATTELAGATYIAPSGGQILDTVDSIGDVYEDGVVSPYDVMSMGLTLDNGSRGQTAIGTDGYVGVAHDACSVSGSIEVYFESLDFYNTFKNQEKVSLQYLLEDGDGKKMVVTLPAVKYTEQVVNVEGLGTDIMAKGNYIALYDDGIDGTIQLSWLTK